MSRNVKVLLGVLGGALVVVLTVFAGIGLFGSGTLVGWVHMMGGWGVLALGLMMLGMVLFPLMLLGGLVAAIILAVTQLGSGSHEAV